MSKFYASIQGNRGEATRMGTDKSGITGHIRGWHFGVNVKGFVGRDGEDCFHVYLTHGSTGNGTDLHVGTYTKEDLNNG
jgi:hypothetical protein